MLKIRRKEDKERRPKMKRFPDKYLETILAIQVTNTDEMKDILADKTKLENDKNKIQDQMENQHSYKIEQNYIKEADKKTAYHFSRNCNNKSQSAFPFL